MAAALRYSVCTGSAGEGFHNAFTEGPALGGDQLQVQSDLLGQKEGRRVTAGRSCGFERLPPGFSCVRGVEVLKAALHIEGGRWVTGKSDCASYLPEVRTVYESGHSLG